MFQPLRSEVDDRFHEVELFFRSTRTLKGTPAATAKGLTFVHLYGAYEFTVRGVVQAAIDSINSRGHKMKDLSPSLLALYLVPEFDSARNSGLKAAWSSRIRLFERAVSSDPLTLPNNVRAPTDGSHFRHSHLVTIFEVLGIRRSPTRRKRHLHRIDEVVNNRNKVAHGEETAAAIGRNYSRGDIVHVIRQMKSVCDSVVLIVENFCADDAKHRRPS